jgi:hypothetical protein
MESDMSLRTTILAAAIVAVLATTASAGTVDLTATDDAMLFSGSYSNTNYGSDVRMGIYWGSARQKSLVKFDLGSIDSGATITSAILTLYVDGHGSPWNNSNNEAMDLYRVTESWDEGTVTWNNRSGITSWSTTGGTYAGTGGNPYATSTQSVASVGDPVTWDVTDLVEEWVAGTSDNHGLIIMGAATYGNQMHFYSLENKATDGSDYYATLTVTAVPLPAAGIAGLGLLAGMGVVAVVRRRRR